MPGFSDTQAQEVSHPRPALTADCVVFGLDLDAEALRVLLVRRAREPFLGRWALPGGFVEPGECPQTAAARELEEETGLHDVFLEQLYTFGKPGRDPRGWVVSVASLALVRLDMQQPEADSDASEAAWHDAYAPPPLAFDHQIILDTALERLRGKIRYQPIGFRLLPPKFTLSQLQTLYEVILQRPLDKRNFRKKILSMGLLRELNETERRVAHRAARLYCFDEVRYRQFCEEGAAFSI